jgi:histone-lysine N-methyltransferase SUV39H
LKKQSSEPFTPSPAPEGNVSVIIPSPSAQLKREIDSAERLEAELTGLSEKYYPTDVHERRAIRGSYPAARKTNRAVVPFFINNPGPFLTERGRRPVQELLCKSLKKKLASIKGPAVTVTQKDEKLLAERTSGFEFINEYKLRDGVTPIGKEFNAGCGCSVVCSPDRCGCLTQEETSDRRIIPYQRAADNARFLVLSPEFLGRTSMIYECNSLCGCNDKCWNRVIEQGRQIRLEIFFTGPRGFGMPLKHIKQNQTNDPNRPSLS